MARYTVSSGDTPRPCDGCALHDKCCAHELACHDFAMWVVRNKSINLRRDPTAGIFDLVFENERYDHVTPDDIDVIRRVVSAS